MKRLLAILLFIAISAAFIACSKQTSAPKEQMPEQKPAALSANEAFKLGDETYALEKWVALPEYDTDKRIGVGLCFVQKEGVAPIVISGGGYKSLIDMKLNMDGTQLSTSNISFIKDAPGYAGRVTFEFALPKGEALPISGTIFHTGKNEKVELDLTVIEALPIEASPKTNTSAMAPAPDDFGIQAFFGEWVLDKIIFHTPNEDNGIYTIDATMSITEGFEYGRDLSLRKDKKMVSVVDLSALIEAVPELPFTINDLDFKDYSGFAYANGTLTLTPVGPAFTASCDEAAKELRLTRSGEVAIIPNTVNGMKAQSGTVLIDITLVFKAK